MGYDCLWGALSARVLINNPTGNEQRNDVEFSPRMTMMEYKNGQLPGLFEHVRDHGTAEITVEGVAYVVRDVQAITDGDLFQAQIILDV